MLRAKILELKKEIEIIDVHILNLKAVRTKTGRQIRTLECMEEKVAKIVGEKPLDEVKPFEEVAPYNG